MDSHRHALAIAEGVTAQIAGEALAVALTGSVAAGTDHPDSDIDLIALTEAPREIEVRAVEGRMVTIGWKSPAGVREAFDHPWEAGVAVPTWRSAKVMSDPAGILAAIRAEAASWDWSQIAPAADRWAGEGLVGLAEEAHKVCGMLATGRLRAAAANRSILALQLPGLVGAAERLMYDTENDLWDLVAEAMGPEWTRAWDAAAGAGAVDLAASCRAGLRLYCLAAERLRRALTGEQREVVDIACSLAERNGA